jgi:hypothetical protein
MSEAVYGPIVTFIATIWFAWLLVKGFRTGAMELPLSVTFSGRRRDEPVRFWLMAVLLGFLTLSMVAATVGQLFFPHGL